MPYIKDEDKTRAINSGASTAGELNFLLTLTLKEYLSDYGTSYQTINNILGALEGTKLEFYRRVAVPYEDQKMKENGDVYLPR